MARANKIAVPVRPDRFDSLRRYHSQRCELGPDGPWILQKLVTFETDFSEDAQLRRGAERLTQSKIMFLDVLHGKAVPYSEEIKFKVTIFAFRMGNETTRKALTEEIGICERNERGLSWPRFLAAFEEQYGRTRGTHRPSWRHSAREAGEIWLDYSAHYLATHGEKK